MLGRSAQLVKAGIICDVSKDGSGEADSGPHVAFVPDADDAIRRVVALGLDSSSPQPGHSLIIYRGSHKTLLNATQFHGWTSMEGFVRSSPALDEAFSRSLPLHEPTRVRVEAFQPLVFDGRLLHSADRSTPMFAGTPAGSRTVACPKLRFHFGFAPDGWPGAGHGEPEHWQELSSAPLARLAPGLHSQVLSSRFIGVRGNTALAVPADAAVAAAAAEAEVAAVVAAEAAAAEAAMSDDEMDVLKPVSD